MRLLIDSVPVGSGGLLQLRDELSTSAAKHAPPGCSVILLAASGSMNIDAATNLTIVQVDKPKWRWAGRWWWYNRTLPRLASLYEADVIYSLSGILTAKSASKAGTVTTVNNMVPFSQDIDGSLFRRRRDRVRYSILRRLYVKALRLADAVVLHSQHALNLVTPFSGDISDKTFITLTGVPTDLDHLAFTRVAEPDRSKPYILYFSAFYPYKNHIRVIEAYKQSLSIEPGLPDLVFAGKPVDEEYFRRVMKSLDGDTIGSRVRYIGTLDRNDIPALIAKAVINVFASTCETNPVTVAEILALGGVLACSSTAPLPEIVEDAGEYFDPFSVDSIAKTLLRLYADTPRRQVLRDAARARGQQLTWDACGAKVWEAASRARLSFERRRKSRDS
jgi:glycosyltransferase involved in cell wall biosynthesis